MGSREQVDGMGIVTRSLDALVASEHQSTPDKRAYRKSGVPVRHLSGYATYQELTTRAAIQPLASRTIRFNR
jgi:hypothetical protein